MRNPPAKAPTTAGTPKQSDPSPTVASSKVTALDSTNLAVAEFSEWLRREAARTGESVPTLVKRLFKEAGIKPRKPT